MFKLKILNVDRIDYNIIRMITIIIMTNWNRDFNDKLQLSRKFVQNLWQIMKIVWDIIRVFLLICFLFVIIFIIYLVFWLHISWIINKVPIIWKTTRITTTTSHENNYCFNSLDRDIKRCAYFINQEKMVHICT